MSSWPRRRRLGSLGGTERSALEAATGGDGGGNWGGGTAAGGTAETAAHAGSGPAMPSPADAAWRESRAAASFDARLQLFPLLMHGATQATTLLGWHSMPAAEIAQRVVSTLTVALFWALPTFWPVPYMRHRTVCLLSSRISFFAWPLLRKPRGAYPAATSCSCHCCLAVALLSFDPGNCPSDGHTAALPQRRHAPCMLPRSPQAFKACLNLQREPACEALCAMFSKSCG